jgi:hypothetical protein
MPFRGELSPAEERAEPASTIFSPVARDYPSRAFGGFFRSAALAAPQQNQRSRSTASAFDQTANRLVRPLGYRAHFPVVSGVFWISARVPFPPA